jgi:hypothetical protein
MARRLLTDPAPELRGSFEDLMLKNGQFRWSRLENLMEQGSKSQVCVRVCVVRAFVCACMVYVRFVCECVCVSVRAHMHVRACASSQA